MTEFGICVGCGRRIERTEDRTYAYIWQCVDQIELDNPGTRCDSTDSGSHETAPAAVTA